MRLTWLVIRSFEQDIGTIIARLERHARIADHTAVATELLRAAEFRKETERRQNEEIKNQCERWLKPSEVEHTHLHQVQARLDGTCDWIKSNDVFQRWMNPGCLTMPDRLLIISGTHGCGKSVLASSIVVGLDTGQHRTLFFSFSISDQGRQTSENLIRTILWQLLQNESSKESLELVQQLRGNGQPMIPALWETLGRIASSLPKPVYCIIDGIDECLDFNHTTFSKIKEISGMCANLRVLLLGRPHVLQQDSVGSDFGRIDITSTLLNQDIEAFVENEIATSDILSLQDFRVDVSRILKEKSDGMFLWVRLMVGDLRKSASKFEFNERLQNLPRGLEKAYQLVLLRLTQKLDRFELRLAQYILASTIVSCRRLTFNELRYALALHCKSAEAVERPLEDFLLLQPSHIVANMLGGLVYLNDDSLRLIHSSVRDFLIRPTDQWICESDQTLLSFRVDTVEAHRSFAWICLDYLGLEKGDRQYLESDISHSLRDLRDSYPLLGYATIYTFSHLNQSGPLCSKTVAKIEGVLGSTQGIFWVEHFVHLLFEDLTLGSQVVEYDDLLSSMSDTGLDLKFFAIFEKKVVGLTSQLRQSDARDHRDLKEQLDLLLDLATYGPFRPTAQVQDLEAVHPIPEPSTADLDLRNPPARSTSITQGSSATVSRLMDLLKNHDLRSTAHQVELFLRLQSFLRKTHILVDPLKSLFQLILRKSSSIPVYALLAIGKFYWNLDKFQEALDIFTAASRKIDHLNIRLKFETHFDMGDCLNQLDKFEEAIRFYEKAYSGFNRLRGGQHRDTLNTLKAMAQAYWNQGLFEEALRSYEKVYSENDRLHGRRHIDTLDCLDSMIHLNHNLGRSAEALRLCETIYNGQDSIPELDVSRNVYLQVRRSQVYRSLRMYDASPYMEHCLRATLKEFQDSRKEGETETCHDTYAIGLLFYHLEYADDLALELFQRAYEACEKLHGPNDKLTILDQVWIARTYDSLGQYTDAKRVWEIVYEKQRSVYGLDHPEIQWTKSELDELISYIEHSNDLDDVDDLDDSEDDVIHQEADDQFEEEANDNSKEGADERVNDGAVMILGQ